MSPLSVLGVPMGKSGSKWAIDFNNATIWDLKTGYEDEGYEHEFTRCARQDNQED